MKNLRLTIISIVLTCLFGSAAAQWRFGAQANATQPVNKNYFVHLNAGKEKVFSPNFSLVKSMILELSKNNYNYYFMNDEYLFKYDINNKNINILGMLSAHLHYKCFFFEFSFFGGLNPYSRVNGSEQFSDYTLKSTPEELEQQRNKLNEIRNPETLVPGFKMLKAGTLLNAGVKGKINKQLTLSLLLGLRQELGNDKMLFTTGISIGRRAGLITTQ